MASEEETVLLIGGSSFLGFHTAETLYYFYNIVSTYYHSDLPKFYPEFNWFQIDLSLPVKDLELNVEKLIEKMDVKYLVNFAGISSPLEAKQKKPVSDLINDKANAILAKVCGKQGVIPIFISTDHIFHVDSCPYT